ncbi:MAG: methyltransferase domain-containing protein [Nitrospiraceae bacterium]|nr:methyltransferase domain-containing protein [Nitrospiraceae bacterium]
MNSIRKKSNNNQSGKCNKSIKDRDNKSIQGSKSNRSYQALRTQKREEKDRTQWEIYEPSDDSYFLIECIESEIRELFKSSKEKKNHFEKVSGYLNKVKKVNRIRNTTKDIKSISHKIGKQPHESIDINILEMGCGSGVVLLSICKFLKDKEIKIKLNEFSRVKITLMGLDINPKAVDYCRELFTKECDNERIINFKFHRSDLFSYFKSFKDIRDVMTFDYILFNAPYLPYENREEMNDVALNGGLDVILPFLRDVKKYLKKNGEILLLFSSLTGRNRILKYSRKMNYNYKLISKKHLFFEQLYVYKFYMK